MPRTFSLAMLLIVITLACLLCGLAANNPDFFQPLPVLYVCAPGALVTLPLVCLSKHRGLLLFNSLVGAVFGFAVLPLIGPFLEPEPGSFGQPDYAFTLPAIGALLFGSIFLLAEIYESRLQRR